MCEFHGSNGNGFGDIWWPDNPIYFSSIDVRTMPTCFPRLSSTFPVVTFPSDFFIILSSIATSHTYLYCESSLYLPVPSSTLVSQPCTAPCIGLAVMYTFHHTSSFNLLSRNTPYTVFWFSHPLSTSASTSQRN